MFSISFVSSGAENQAHMHTDNHAVNSLQYFQYIVVWGIFFPISITGVVGN